MAKSAPGVETDKKLGPGITAPSGGLPSTDTKLSVAPGNNCLIALPKALVHFPLAPGPLPAALTKPPSHLAASPPGLRLETLGFPSLSVPPEMVRPSVLPSFLISSTTVTPRNSSANRWEGRVRGKNGAILGPQP